MTAPMHPGRRIQIVLFAQALAVMLCGLFVAAAAGLDPGRSTFGLRVGIAAAVFGVLAGCMNRWPMIGRLGFWGGVVESVLFGANYLRIFARRLDGNLDAADHALPVMSVICLLTLAVLMIVRPPKQSCRLPDASVARRVRRKTQVLAVGLIVAGGAVMLISGEISSAVRPLVLALVIAAAGALAGRLDRAPFASLIGFRLAVLASLIGAAWMIVAAVLSPPWGRPLSHPDNIEPIMAVLCIGGAVLLLRQRSGFLATVRAKRGDAVSGPSVFRRMATTLGMLLFVVGWCTSRSSELRVMVTAEAADVLAPALMQDERFQQVLGDPRVATLLQEANIDADEVAGTIAELVAEQGTDGLMELVTDARAGNADALLEQLAGRVGTADGDVSKAIAETMDAFSGADAISAVADAAAVEDVAEVADLPGGEAPAEIGQGSDDETPAGAVDGGPDLSEIVEQKLQAGEDLTALVGQIGQIPGARPDIVSAALEQGIPDKTRAPDTRDGTSRVVFVPPSAPMPPSRLQPRVAPTIIPARDRSMITPPTRRTGRAAAGASARRPGGRAVPAPEAEPSAPIEVVPADPAHFVEPPADEPPPEDDGPPVPEGIGHLPVIHDVIAAAPAEPPAPAEIDTEEGTAAAAPVPAPAPAPVLGPAADDPMTRAMARIDEIGRIANLSGTVAMIVGAFTIVLGMGWRRTAARAQPSAPDQTH